jgi:hypothetical protein
MTIAQAQVTGIGPPLRLAKGLKVSTYVVPVEILLNQASGKNMYTGQKLLPANSSIQKIVGLDVFVESKFASFTSTIKAPGECLQWFGNLNVSNEQFFRISCDESDLSFSKIFILDPSDPTLQSHNFIIQVTHK